MFEKKKNCCFYQMRAQTRGLGFDHGGGLSQCGKVLGYEFFMASLYVWYVQYCALCDVLVTLKL